MKSLVNTSQLKFPFPLSPFPYTSPHPFPPKLFFHHKPKIMCPQSSQLSTHQPPPSSPLPLPDSMYRLSLCRFAEAYVFAQLSAVGKLPIPSQPLPQPTCAHTRLFTSTTEPDERLHVLDSCTTPEVVVADVVCGKEELNKEKEGRKATTAEGVTKRKQEKFEKRTRWNGGVSQVGIKKRGRCKEEEVENLVNMVEGVLVGFGKGRRKAGGKGRGNVFGEGGIELPKVVKGERGEVVEDDDAVNELGFLMASVSVEDGGGLFMGGAFMPYIT